MHCSIGGDFGAGVLQHCTRKGVDESSQTQTTLCHESRVQGVSKYVNRCVCVYKSYGGVFGGHELVTAAVLVKFCSSKRSATGCFDLVSHRCLDLSLGSQSALSLSAN